MNENKKTELKKTIELFQKELEEMKQKDPEGDYSKIEKIISHLNDLLNGVQHKGYMLSLFMKLIFFTILIYISYAVCVGVVFGFGYSFINNSNPLRYTWIIPVLAFVIFLFHKLLDILLNKMPIHHPMLNYVLINFLFIFGLAMVDTYYLHVASSLSDSLFLLTAITVLTFFSEIYMTKKVYMNL